MAVLTSAEQERKTRITRLYGALLLSFDNLKLFTTFRMQLWDLAERQDTKTRGARDGTTDHCCDTKSTSRFTEDKCAGRRKKSHLEVDFGGSSNHAETEGGHVNSPITFSKDEKVILRKIGELGKETQQGPIIIIGDLKEQRVQRRAGLKV